MEEQHEHHHHLHVPHPDMGPSEPTHTEFHIVSPMTYLIIGGCLLVLTASTTAISYVDLGEFNAVVALAIACMKATLVVLFFMHVKYSSKLTKLTVACGFFTFLVLITMTMTDYISRAWGRW
ncbi:MAG: cytochrome C oxidase subunit IV family protein [Acidobacteriaceae bacterium]